MPDTAFDEDYVNGVLQNRVQRIISDAEIQRRDAPQRIKNAYNQLRTFSTQAQAIGNASTNPTQAQVKALFTSFGKVCDGLADLLLHLSLNN